VIDRKDNLLLPRFYLANGLKDWLRETVAAWTAERANWVV
jgi:hypothetical protein